MIQRKNYYYEQKPNDNTEPKIKDITQFQLEKIISSPFRNVKYLGRKITRINNIESREIKEIDKEKCCNKICSCYFIELIKIFLFSFICFLIFSLEIAYYESYDDTSFGNKNGKNSINSVKVII